ncbi:MAG: peptide ABC transporter substrate-binding protein [Proteobacteria bacterium]|nr:peptide ABC transporter substrate-binding protein [Pseudomonadota bacterium]
MIIKILSWIQIIVIVIFFSACTTNDDETIEPVVEQPKNPDYLRLPLSDNIETFDPSLIYTDAQIELVEQLFLGLTDLEPKTYAIIPELATEWQVSQDGLVYTYKLRQDVQWTEGKPVTAHDVVWAIQRNIINSPYAFTLYPLKNAQAISQHEITSLASLGVRAIDDYTVEFTLEQAAGYFPALTSFWTYAPLPRTVIEQYGEKWIDLSHLQTNGSYQLTEWKPDSLLILKKNPNYYAADKVQIEKVHYYVLPESSLAFAMYKTNKLDIIGGQAYLSMSQPVMASIKSNMTLRAEQHSVAKLCTEWYGFNVQRPPMDNILVRKAIMAAIDKKSLINIVLEAKHIPTMTFTQPFGIELPEKTGIVFDPIHARNWLIKAGYPQGKNFPPIFMLHNNSKLHATTAKAIKKMLKHHLNIEVEVRSLELERYINILAADTPHIFRMNWCAMPDAEHWLYEVFHPDKGINWIGWDNNEFAKLVTKARQISDPTGRAKLYQRAEKILTETEAAIIPLYFETTPFLVKPWVQNWSYKPFGGQHIRNWSLEQK